MWRKQCRGDNIQIHVSRHYLQLISGDIFVLFVCFLHWEGQSRLLCSSSCSCGQHKPEKEMPAKAKITARASSTAQQRTLHRYPSLKQASKEPAKHQSNGHTVLQSSHSVTEFASKEPCRHQSKLKSQDVTVVLTCTQLWRVYYFSSKELSKYQTGRCLIQLKSFCFSQGAYVVFALLHACITLFPREPWRWVGILNLGSHLKMCEMQRMHSTPWMVLDYMAESWKSSMPRETGKVS